MGGLPNRKYWLPESTGIVTVNCPPLLTGAAATGIQFAGFKFVVLSNVQSLAQPGQLKAKAPGLMDVVKEGNATNTAIALEFAPAPHALFAERQ